MWTEVGTGRGEVVGLGLGVGVGLGWQDLWFKQDLQLADSTFWLKQIVGQIVLTQGITVGMGTLVGMSLPEAAWFLISKFSFIAP